MLSPDREQEFPNLAGSGYQRTSGESSDYNCVAWAAGETHTWYDAMFPHLWPRGLPRSPLLRSYVRLFESHGYAVCEDAGIEEGFEKIALYTDEFGAFTHAARQLENGWWTSKLGDWEDIEHPSLENVSSGSYGTVAAILRRPIESSSGNQ